MKPCALTIAGSDPSGGAGIQADLKTFHQFGVYGMSVVTLLTVQNTRQVSEVFVTDPARVLAQLDTVLEDMPCHAAKTGALGHAAVIEAVAARAARFSFPLVVDPVMISKHGAPLLEENAREAFRKKLLPHALLVTPNLHEAEVLAGFPVRDEDAMHRAAREIVRMGPKAVLVKGGHLEGEAVDVLFWKDELLSFRSPRLPVKNTHGTGCTFSAAVTAGLARGQDLALAVSEAKKFITEAIRTAPGLGHGVGPVNHHAGF